MIPCWCRKCLPTSSLATIAPRLARARDQLLEDRRKARQERTWLRERVMDSERVLAHRELQLIRAAARGRRTGGGMSDLKARAQGGLFDGCRYTLRVDEPPEWIWIQPCDVCGSHMRAAPAKNAELYRRDEVKNRAWVYVFTDERLDGRHPFDKAMAKQPEKVSAA